MTCCLHCTFLRSLPKLGSRSLSQLPSYNYGLPGKGKSKRAPGSGGEESIKVQGEVLFGLHPTHLALQAQRRKRFFQLFVDHSAKEKDALTAIKELAQKLHLNITAVSRDKLNKMSGNRPHQGVCLDAEPLRIPKWSEQEQTTGSDKGHPLWLMLHNIQDPMNFGAILRSAYFLGVEKVIVPAQNSCRLSPVVSKASAGAMELVDMVSVPEHLSLTSVCQWWKAQGGIVLGTGFSEENHSLLPLHECGISSPTLVILGNEGCGVSEDLIHHCDQVLSIPQVSQLLAVGSLNVSVAAGIILHWLRYSSGLPSS